jgi:16S rRNA (cytosine1402-N4)-methyltransferase
MVSTGPDNDVPPSPGAPRRRRPRYAGKYPRQYDLRYKELHPEVYPEIQEHVRARGRTPAGTHIPILVNEVMGCLRPMPGDVVADCTVGCGGHAAEFVKRIRPEGRLIGLDVDAAQLETARRRLADVHGSVALHRSNFAGVDKVLAAEQLDGFDIIFADLGFSSVQVDDPSRGFSYKFDGPLNMRMDDRRRRTAADLLASMSMDELSAALRDLADEPDHERIARAIVDHRATQPITQTLQLVHLIFQVKGLSRRTWRRQIPGSEARLHPAARTFQALRILVNDELAGLAQLLRVAPYCLRPGGRIGIISFHSGEDRLVKKSFREGLQAGMYAAIADEVIRPAAEERRSNPRSASAKFRWARRP